MKRASERARCVGVAICIGPHTGDTEYEESSDELDGGADRRRRRCVWRPGWLDDDGVLGSICGDCERKHPTCT